MNHCKCGHAADLQRQCICSELEITNYRRRLSGPLADRIDMHVTMSPVSIESLTKVLSGETSASIRERVERSRTIQRARYATRLGSQTNASAARRLIWGDTDASAREVLRAASESLGLSARGHDRVLRVARTIADLAESERISHVHVAEAVAYRPR